MGTAALGCPAEQSSAVRTPPDMPEPKGTFAGARPYPSLGRSDRKSLIRKQTIRKKRGLRHVHFSPLVRAIRYVLAAGRAGAGRLSLHLADPAAVPHRRHRRPW